MLSTRAKTPLEIIAHRGASYDAPENTLASINLAWKVDADAVEIDVRLTKDNRIIVMHDPDASRIAGVDWKTAEHTLDELQTLDIGRWKGEEWTGERIATLEQALSTVPEGKRLIIEIKCGPEIIPEFLRVLEASGKTNEQVAVISFHSSVIAEMKKARPDLQAYWLCSPSPDNSGELLDTARSINADGIDAKDTDSFDEKFVQLFREAGMQLYVWTVDNEDKAIKYARLGVDGITTNRPAEMRRWLDGEGTLTP